MADGHPGAAGGDAEGLVVVAVGAAGGEGVAQPEAPAGADRVGQVGEAGGALVGGHDEVGVVAVAPAGNGGHVVAHHVVGDLQEAGDEHGVGLGRVGAPLPAGADRRLLDDEAALGPGRHDDRVLEHLGPHEVEHLAAIVVDPVAPADAAPGHRPPAQVDPLHRRPVHEDLPVRHGPGGAGHGRAVELEGQVIPHPAVAVGAQGGVDQGEEAPQDPVVVEPGDGVAVVQAAPAQLGHHFGAGGAARVEEGGEQLEHGGGDRRVLHQHLVDVAGRERGADLAAVPPVGPEHGDVVPGQLRPQDQAVQGVGLGPAVPQGERGSGQPGAVALHVEGAAGIAHPEVVQMGVGLLPAEHVGLVLHRPQAQALDDGKEPGQLDAGALGEHLEAGGRAAVAPGRQHDTDALRAGEERLELGHIVNRPLDGDDVAVAGREPVGPGLGQALPGRLPRRGDQRLAQPLVPRPAQQPQLPLE